MDPNQPSYRISGKDRRILKKEYNKIKSFLKNFWWHHQNDKDMSNFYTGSEKGLISDEYAKFMYEVKKSKLEKLEIKLNELNE